MPRKKTTDERFIISLPTEVKLIIKKEAENKQISMAEWIRQVVLESSDKISA